MIFSIISDYYNIFLSIGIGQKVYKDSNLGILIGRKKSSLKMEVDLLEKIDRFLEWLLHIFSLKRTKITLYIVAVLWLSLVTQIIMNRVFLQDLKIAEAFVKTNSEELECNLEIIAEHHMDFLSEEDKLVEREKTIAVQVNGKVRATITISVDDEEDVIKEKALQEENVKRYIEGKEIVKTIVIKGRIVNIVVR